MSTTWKHLAILSVLTLFVAAAIRLVNLGNFPLFADESIYVRWAQVMRAEPSLRFLPLSDGKQPLYMWIVIPGLKVFSDPVVAGRTISVIAGLATVSGVGLLAYLLFSNLRIVWLSTLISATLPFLVFFDRLALADSLLTALLVWAVTLGLASLKFLRLDLAMLAGFAFGLAWLTKSPAQIILFLFAICLLLSARPLTRLRLIKSLGLYLVILVIAFGMYNLLRLGPQFHMIALRNQDYIYPLTELLRHPLDPLKPHLIDSLNFLWAYLTPVGFLLALWGCFDVRRSHLAPRLILGVLFFSPIFINSFIAKAYTARYILFCIPYAAILMAHALDHLGTRTQKHFLTIFGALLLVGSSLFLDFKLISQPESFPMPRIERSGYLEEWTAGYGLKEVSAYLKHQAASGQSIVVGSEGFFGTPFDGLQLYLNGVTNVRIVGVGVWIEGVHDSLVAATRENQVFLVINSSRLHADPATFKPPVKLLASYPKAIRPDGTRDALLFFEVLKP